MEPFCQGSLLGFPLEREKSSKCIFETTLGLVKKVHLPDGFFHTEKCEV